MLQRLFVFSFLLIALGSIWPCHAMKTSTKKRDNIWWAASKGNKETVTYWVTKDKSLLSEWDIKFGATVLHWAVKRGHPEIVTYLLESEADVNILDKQNKTPLYWAPDENTVQLLINRGACVDCQDTNGKTPLHWITDEKIVPLLIRAGADVDAKDNEGKNALQWAAGTGHHKVAQALIKAGSDINARDESGKTALHIAVQAGDLPMVELLLEQKGIDVNCVDTVKQRTALQWAIRRSVGAAQKKYKQNSIATTCRMIVALMKKGADSKLIDRKKKAPVLWIKFLNCSDQEKNMLHIAFVYNSLTKSHQKKFMELLKDFE